MHKPSYGVVTAVVVVLAILAFVSKFLVDLIPAGPENRLASETAEFLVQASHEQIDWRLLGEEAFADARKQDKPLMLVVGTACSPTGRAMDKEVFIAKEIRGYLARNFICVRVDAMARPEYQNAFLPISRAVQGRNGRLAIPPDYQVWFLDPKGYVFGYAAENVAGQPLDSKSFYDDLIKASDQFVLEQEGKAQAGSDQRRDLAILEAATSPERPDLQRYAEYLASASGRAGGFPVNGFQRLWPAAWKFELMLGRYQDYEKSIGPCLDSPEVDLLDGGFFTDASGFEWRGIGYDRLAVTNAAMMQTVAEGSLLMEDANQRWLALRTFDSLLGDFARDGLIRAGQIGDEGALGRSSRYSFSPRRLREIFPNEVEREWAQRNLGLLLAVSSQMTPMLGRMDARAREPQQFETAIEALRKGGPAAKYAGLAQLDVGGFATARMMEVARILGDGSRLAMAEGLFERLDEFRSLNDVVHSRSPGAGSYAYLGDYLAYADGALQYFLATGNKDVFQNGLDVLRRGLFLYGSKAKGVYCLSQPVAAALAPQDLSTPEIVDNVRESCSAQVIRLCNDYGRLLGSRGADLDRAASDTLTRFEPIAAALGQFAGGYYCAAVAMNDPSFAVAVGPQAIEEATILAGKAPTSLVAPAVGPVHAPAVKLGYYVLRDTTFQGPLTLEETVMALRQAAGR